MAKFPLDLFCFYAGDFELVGSIVSGGQSISGLAQTSSTNGGGYWRATASIRVNTPERRKRWRAWRARMKGGAAVIDVPWMIGDTVVLVGTDYPALASHSDGSSFSDGTQYIISPKVSAVFAQSYALRSTQVSLNFAQPVNLVGGEPLSVKNGVVWSLHIIEEVVSRNENQYTLLIDPPLRQAVTVSTSIEFDQPLCTMKLAAPFVGADFDVNRHAFPQLVFVENIEPQAAT